MRKTRDLRWKLLSYAGMAMMMCIIFVVFSITAFAAEGKVTASAAKIRKEASTSSEAVGSAVRGDKYTINSEVTGSDGRVWYQITFDGNKTGYIRSDLMEKSGDVVTGGTVSPSLEVENVQPVSAKITGNTVRVRSDATTEGSSIIANVVKDSVVTITGRAKDNQNKTWYLVSFSSDTGEVTGFIREDFLSVSGTVSPIEDITVVDPPVVDDEPVAEPQAPQVPVITEKYYVIEEDGDWFLVDRDAGLQYGTESLIKAAVDNLKVIEEYQKTNKAQKAWIIILVILVAALGIVVALLFLKLREVMDEAYFSAVEKETIRQRQGQKANNPSSASKSVMHTVGTGANKQGAPSKTTVAKPANTRPAQQQKLTEASATPQTVKVSNPADTRVPKPVGQQRTTGHQQKPMNKQPKDMEIGEAQPKTVAPGAQQTRPVQQKPVENTSKQSWQSKNFVDDDDDFEFEFLNWDGSEEE